MRTDRQQVIDWARALLAEGSAVILDSETTGLDTTDEIVQLAIIDLSGQVLLDTYVKPSIPIPAAAQRIHGITDAMVASSPTFDQVWPQIATILAGRSTVIYNASYDTSKLVGSRACAGGAYEGDISGWWHRYEQADAEIQALRFECAMERYAIYYGDYSDYFGSYKWKPLPGGDHSALGDAKATLNLIKRMAGHVDIGIAREQLTNE